MKERKEEGKEEKKKKEKKKRKGMETMILVWIFGLRYGKINHKPIFYEFGSKRTLLGIWALFGSFILYLELFWFGFVVYLGLYGN